MPLPASVVDGFIAACVVPHGLTDLWIPESLQHVVLVYALCCILLCEWIPTEVVWLIGLAASVVHFSADVGIVTSLAFVWLLLGCHLLNDDAVAFTIFVEYMAFVHLPHHYQSQWPNLTAWFVPCMLVVAGVGVRCGIVQNLYRYPLLRRAAVAVVTAHAYCTSEWAGLGSKS